MFRSSTVALLRRAAASAAPQQQHYIAVSLMTRNGASAMAGAVRRQLAAPSSLVTRSMGTHAGGDAMPNGGMPVGTGAGGRSSTSAALADLLGRELQEEKELMENEDRAPELEEVSEKIHKRFHIKESPGSRCVGMWVRCAVECKGGRRLGMPCNSSIIRTYHPCLLSTKTALLKCIQSTIWRKFWCSLTSRIRRRTSWTLRSWMGRRSRTTRWGCEGW